MDVHIYTPRLSARALFLGSFPTFARHERICFERETTSASPSLATAISLLRRLGHGVRRKLSFAHESIASVPALYISRSPVRADRQLVAQAEIVDPILGNSHRSPRDRESLPRNGIASFVQAFYSAEAGRPVQRLGTRRATAVASA